MDKVNKPRPNRPVSSIDGFTSRPGRQHHHPGHKIPPERPDLRTRGQQFESHGRLDNFAVRDGFHSVSQPVIQPTVKTKLGRQPKRDHEGKIDLSLPAAAPKKTKKFNWKRIAKRTALGLTALLIILGGFLGWKFYKNTSKVFQGSIFGFLKNTKLKGEDKGRITILVAGNSADDPGHNGGDLTDSIMLISVDTINNNGFIMSIPRDLWVEYGTSDCSIGYQGKINAVYECGEEIKFSEDGFPKGGMGLLEKDVEQDFGIDINYYALINYTAMREAVDAVGGINFNVQSSDPRGLYDPSIDWTTKGPLVKLTNGMHSLNGRQALDLARARGDAYGSYGYPQADFTRTQNQRQMLLALKDKALSIGTLSNPAKISSLLDAIGNNVQTDFKTEEIRRLYDISKLIQNNNVQSVGLADKNVNLVKSANFTSVSALIPSAGQGNFSQIQAFVKRLTSNDPVSKEGASVVVLNGSGVSGLAAQKGQQLTEKGLTVAAIANTTSTPKTVVIMKNNSKTATNTYLKQKFNVTSNTDVSAFPFAQNYDADFVIILGSNEASSN